MNSYIVLPYQILNAPFRSLRQLQLSSSLHFLLQKYMSHLLLTRRSSWYLRSHLSFCFWHLSLLRIKHLTLSPLLDRQLFLNNLSRLFSQRVVASFTWSSTLSICKVKRESLFIEKLSWSFSNLDRAHRVLWAVKLRQKLRRLRWKIKYDLRRRIKFAYLRSVSWSFQRFDFAG